MLSFIIGLLTVVMVLDCVLLILLVLVQLPKKEAGAGMAFGGAATDALFGAGSGNALTMITKYAAAVFFVLALTLSVLSAQAKKSKSSDLEKALQQSKAPAALPGLTTSSNSLLTPAPTPAPATKPATTNK